MNIEIKSLRTGAVLFSADVGSLKLCVMVAISARANLSGAYLSRADLSGANLSGANLNGANLSCANLNGANLSCAYLSHADLSGVNLRRADLSGANLYGADLGGADLRGATGAELAIARTRILPDGDLIGWKKCDGGVIVKLCVPADAKRSHAFERKCRAEFADVLEVCGAEVAYTKQHGPTLTYRAGERVTPDAWDDNWMNECSHGIHFFITREEAENYAC